MEMITINQPGGRATLTRHKGQTNDATIPLRLLIVTLFCGAINMWIVFFSLWEAMKHPPKLLYPQDIGVITTPQTKTPGQSACPVTSVKSCAGLTVTSILLLLLDGVRVVIKPWFIPGPFESALLFLILSQLNGTHGEYTDDDDLADVERKRQKKEAKNKMVHGKVGNSHKPMNPGIRTNNLCQDFLLNAECLVPGCPFVHNRGILCPNVNCVAANCPNIHRFVPPPAIEPPAAPIIDVPEFVEVQVLGRSIPTNRVDRAYYTNSITTRIIIFLIWSAMMITLREFLFLRFQHHDVMAYTIMYLARLYLEKIRFVNSVLFILSLQYSDEYVELIRHIKTRRYHLIYEMGPETPYSATVAMLFVAFVYLGYPDLGERMQLFMIAFFLVICFKTWISVADYSEALIHGDQVKDSTTRYDSETWSYRCGATRMVFSEVIDDVVDNLMKEFITSDCTLQSTFNRILYSAVEQAKKLRCNGAEIHIDVIVGCAKLAHQRLKGYQLSCVLDGALIKRPLTAPMI